MGKCKWLQEYMLDGFSRRHFKQIGEELPPEMAGHLNECDSCRQFYENLLQTGEYLDELESDINLQIQIPELSYFDSLIRQSVNRGFKLPEVLLFIGTALLFLAGIGILINFGYLIWIGAFYGMVSSLLPLVILFYPCTAEKLGGW